jgi:phosphoribosylaminoimidazole-succinocarboxamide synthase
MSGWPRPNRFTRGDQMNRGNLIYEGKAKKIYSVEDHPDLLWQEFKNSLTAFNGVKKGEFDVKGSVNRDICVTIFKYFQQHGIATHLVELIDNNVMITRKLNMIPLEVVMRNRVAGSLKKKFNLPEGQEIEPTLVEFYYKDDALNDPFISDDQILMMGLINRDQIAQLKKAGLLINKLLKEFFKKIGIDLVDFKVEFGTNASGEIILADEISPDSCRLWDSKTQEKLDKDRFRFDLGDVKEGYIEVYSRMKKEWGNL